MDAVLWGSVVVVGLCFWLATILLDGGRGGAYDNVRQLYADIILRGLFVPVFIWQAVGVVRCVRRRGWKKQPLSSLAAPVMMLLLALPVFYYLLVTAVQYDNITLRIQLTEQFGDYEVFALQPEAVVGFHGPMGFGLTHEIAHTLSRQKRIGLILMESRGGLVDESRKLRQLIAERGLAAYVGARCDSSCAYAFMGAERRILRSGARLGLHTPFDPYKDEEVNRILQVEETDYLIGRGVDPEFVARSFTVPPDDMWYPTPQALLDAGVITEYIDQSAAHHDVPVRGWRDAVEDEFLEDPAVERIRRADPDGFSRFLSRLDELAEGEFFLSEVKGVFRGYLDAALSVRMARAPDAVAMYFYRAQTRLAERIRQFDPQDCFGHLFLGDAGEFQGEAGRVFFDGVAQVIEAVPEAAPPPPPDREAAVEFDRLLQSAWAAEGADARVVSRRAREGSLADRARLCDVTLAASRMLLQMPPSQAAPMIRSIYRGG